MLIVDTVLPVMLSSKLLPEMEMDDNAKRDQLLQGMQNMPLSLQIEKLKVIKQKYMNCFLDPVDLLFKCAPFYLYRQGLI